MIKTYFFRFLIGLVSLISSVSLLKATIIRPSLKTAPQNSQATFSLKDSMNFKEIISFFGKKYNIPQNLLAAIAKVESENSPWAINAQGRSRMFSSKEAALKYIKTLKQLGITNINVGYMQINLASHERKFKTLDEVLTPYHNIAYAAHLLKRLYLRYGSWEAAVRFYHSYSSEYNVPYKQKVFKAWNKVAGQPISILLISKDKAPLKMVLSPGAGLTKSSIKR